jgi:hypothetical protein
MGGAEGVVFAFRASGEAGKSALLAQRADAVAPARQDLVRIALVADIEDQPVVRRVEDAVDGDRQFDHAEPGAEMPAGARYRIDHLVPDFACKLRQVAILELAQVGGIGDLVEQRGFRRLCHGRALFSVVLALLYSIELRQNKSVSRTTRFSP